MIPSEGVPSRYAIVLGLKYPVPASTIENAVIIPASVLSTTPPVT